MKKLKDAEKTTLRFFNTITLLQDKLGTILFQLPPHWHVNWDRLATFLSGLPKDLRYAFEFRDKTWFCPEIYNILAEHEAAVCIYDLEGERSPTKLTSDVVYVRLHGPEGAYKGQYDRRTLKRWKRQFLSWAASGRQVYCYFDNDEEGYAARDAINLRAMLETDCRGVTG